MSFLSLMPNFFRGNFVLILEKPPFFVIMLGVYV